MKVGGKNQFKPGRYSGPAKACWICGSRTTNILVGGQWQRGEREPSSSVIPVCADHPLPYYRPETATPEGTFDTLRIWK